MASSGDNNSLRRGLAELPLLALIALVVAFVLKTFVAQAYYIPSSSMEPQLHIGDRVIVSKLSYDLHDHTAATSSSSRHLRITASTTARCRSASSAGSSRASAWPSLKRRS